MKDDKVLKKFHQEMRLGFKAEPGYEVIREAPVLRLVSTHSGESFNIILHSDLTSENADSIIKREVDYFKSRNQSFEWKLYNYDSPEDLAARLLTHGFQAEEKEALLVAPVEACEYALSLPSEVSITKIESTKALSEALLAVNTYQGELEHVQGLIANLSIHLQERPDSIGIYAAYWKGQPVSTGWAFYSPGASFCGLFGGTTLPDYRGKGLYKALVQARAREAKAKAFPYVYVDAGPMSQPILKKIGFRELAQMQGFYWRTG